MIRDLRRDDDRLLGLEQLRWHRRHIFDAHRAGAEVVAKGGEVHALVDDDAIHPHRIGRLLHASVFARQRAGVAGFGDSRRDVTIEIAVRIGEEVDVVPGLALEDLFALDQFAMEPRVVIAVGERRLTAVREERMRERVALDVDAGIRHFFDLLPRQRVSGLSDDLRINENGERKFAFLQLGKRLGVGRAPSVIDRDHDRVLRNRLALAGHVIAELLQRDDVISGHGQIAHLLMKRLATDLHPRILRRFDDVIAEDRRSRSVFTRGLCERR